MQCVTNELVRARVVWAWEMKGGGNAETSMRQLVEGLAKRMGWEMGWGNGGRRSMVQAMQRANAKRGIECGREAWVVQG